jgi:hypothetical protein
VAFQFARQLRDPLFRRLLVEAGWRTGCRIVPSPVSLAEARDLALATVGGVADDWPAMLAASDPAALCGFRLHLMTGPGDPDLGDHRRV